MSGSVVNVMAMLTGNASSLVGAMGTGSEATKAFKDTYAKTATDVVASSKEIQAAMQKEAETAVAAASTAQAAAEKKAAAADLAAAQATVAADRQVTAQAKAAAAAQAAADATARAAATGAEADRAAADVQVQAAQKAANAADLAAQQKITAAGKAAEAQKASTTAIAASLQAEKDAQEKTAAVADVAAAQKKAAGEASMATMTKVAAGTAVAVGIVAIGSLDMAAKYEKSTELLVTAGGEAQANLQGIRDGILSISQTTGVGAEQLSEGMYIVEKATYRGAAGLDVLKAAAEGAAAENVDMGTMTNALTSIMMSYHLTSDKAVATTNELVAGAGAAKTTMQDYAASLSSVLPVASAAGISFAEVGGAIATLTQHGTSADESTQELANTIRSLQAPNAVAVSEMQQLGLSATDVAQNLGKRGLTGTVELITEAIQNHLGPAGTVIVNAMKESATGTADLNTMMNKMPPSLKTAAQGFLDGTVSMKDFQKVFKDMGAEGDAQGKQFLALANTVNGYNDQIKQGGPAAQTAAAALKEVMGGATGMNTALMLGGENMKTFKEKTQEMTDAANKNATDISTNAATQATLAQTTARVKATFEALAIELGTVLMPIVKNVLDGFLSMVKFLQDNKGPAEALGLAIAALAGGLLGGVIAAKAWAAGQLIAAAATALFTGDFETLNAVMAINPFIAVAEGLALLVAGLIWAYNNIGWFKDGVDAAWKWIQAAAKAVVDWFVNDAVPWLVGAWNNIVKAWNVGAGAVAGFFQAIGTAANWLWNNILSPVFNFIATAAKILITVIGTVLVLPWILLFNLLAPVVTAFWKSTVEPAFKAIQAVVGAVWKWLVDNVWTPWTNTVNALAVLVTWYWKNVVIPVFQGIQTAIHAVWQWLVDNVWNPWVAEIHAIADVFNWLWHNIVQPVWSGIQSVLKAGWDWIGNNVFNPLKQAVGWVGDAFSFVASAIGRAWDGIKNAAAAPARFVIDTVYNHGIVPAWNAIAGAVGLSGLHLNTAPVGFATGGIMPGYSPGVDNHIIAVSGGEAIMRPEWTRAVGAERIHKMNAMAAGGNAGGAAAMLGFAGGGIVGDILGNIGNFLSNPLGGVKDLLNGAVSGLMGMMGGGDFGKMMGAIPGMFIDQFANLVTGKENALQAAARVSSGPGPVTTNGGSGGAAQWAGVVMQALNMLGQPAFLEGTTLRRMNQESGGNPNAINNWDSNAAAGIPSKGLMQVIPPTFAAYAMPGYNSNIYDPLSNILASMRYAISRYGSLANAYDQPGGYAMGGIAPTLFDQGGYLPVGTSMVQNNTGHPERVLAPGQSGLDGATVYLDIPELGGRITGHIREVLDGDHAETSRSLRNSAGVPQGGF